MFRFDEERHLTLLPVPLWCSVMGKTHYWFGTDNDNASVVSFLRESGAVPLHHDWDSLANAATSGVIIHFPQFGPIVHWPDAIDIRQHEGNHNRFVAAVLAKSVQEQRPSVPIVDVDRSPVASLFLPYKRQDRFWTTGELHFLGSKLPTRLPELNRICGRFERWLKKHELVYDYAKGRPFHPFANHVGGLEMIVRRVYALPEAFALLQQQTPMIDHDLSSVNYRMFLRTLQLRGFDVPQPDVE